MNNAQKIIQDIEQRMAERHFWLGVSRSEAEKLLEYVNSLEQSLADLLRSLYGPKPVQDSRTKPAA